MNAPTLWDVERGCFVKPACELNLPDGRRGEDGQPRARLSDPVTSHEAAAAVSPGCKDCIEAIRDVVANWAQRTARPMDAFHIAYQVERRNPGRWDEGTIRRRVKDAGLMKVDENGVSPRGRACKRWTL